MNKIKVRYPVVVPSQVADQEVTPLISQLEMVTRFEALVRRDVLAADE